MTYPKYIASALLLLFAAALTVAACAADGKSADGGDNAITQVGDGDDDDDDDDDNGSDDDDDDGADSEESDDDDDDDDDDSEDGGDDDDDGSWVFDIGDAEEGDPDDDSGTGECDIPEHEPCDHLDDDIFHAVGLNCPGEPEVEGSSLGSPDAIVLRDHFGNTDTWDPTEGVKYVALGSGIGADLDLAGNEDPLFPINCNDDLGVEWDLPGDLPAPIDVSQVSAAGVNCADDPSLIGTGDCSNTLQEQWDAAAGSLPGGGTAFDYTEMRFTATVPSTVIGVSYDFAFFSTEYPYYYGSPYNDMYVGWMESRNWTGNISFDKDGNPISLNAGFLDYRDVPNPTAATWGFEVDQECNVPGACVAEELHDTCMQYRAGTSWLSTAAGVEEGEDITMVFAVFDLSDPILDSYVFIDNFRWTCEPHDIPETDPVE